jgi:hypothetical protein
MLSLGVPSPVDGQLFRHILKDSTEMAGTVCRVGLASGVAPNGVQGRSVTYCLYEQRSTCGARLYGARERH